jgi:hypothetical protein
VSPEPIALILKLKSQKYIKETIYQVFVNPPSTRLDGNTLQLNAPAYWVVAYSNRSKSLAICLDKYKRGPCITIFPSNKDLVKRNGVLYCANLLKEVNLFLGHT